MSEEKTCKQCEHYQFYDGPERTAGREESVMFCPKLKEQMHGNGYSENVTRCAWGYFTPKKPEQAKTCKQCEHCGPTRNSEWPYSIYCAYHNGHYTLPLVFDCKNFTPKETEKTVERVCSTCGAEGSSIFKEPCYSCYQSIFNRARPNWRPKDTPKKSCRTCGFGIENNGTGKLCNQKCSGMFSEYSLWKPAELKVKINGKPACEYHGLEIEDNNLSDCQKTKESDPGIRSGDFIDGSKIKAETITEEQYKRFNHQQKNPNRKETSMWNKVVHLIRMSVLVLCLVGMFTVGSFVNPKLIWVADVVRPLGDKAVQLESGETVMMKMSYGDHFLAMPGSDMFSVWLVFALAIATAIVIPYLLHIATLKLFNVRKKV